MRKIHPFRGWPSCRMLVFYVRACACVHACTCALGGWVTVGNTVKVSHRQTNRDRNRNHNSQSYDSETHPTSRYDLYICIYGAQNMRAMLIWPPCLEFTFFLYGSSSSVVAPSRSINDFWMLSQKLRRGSKGGSSEIWADTKNQSWLQIAVLCV